MEMKNKVSDLASTFNDFPLSWNISQNLTENTDISNTISQLLNMYQPNNGIAEYEHVLKTLVLLSENLDSNTCEQIISMVPWPKGSSEDEIKAVIFKTTGLIGNSMPPYHKVTIVSEDKTSAPITEESKKDINKNQNAVVNINSQTSEFNTKYHVSLECGNSTQLMTSVSDMFRGFPSNEISMIHSHVKNANHIYDTLDYTVPCSKFGSDVQPNFLMNSPQQSKTLKVPSNLNCKWFHAPHLMYENSSYKVPTCHHQGVFRSMGNKCFQLPVTNIGNYNEYNINMPQLLYQDNTYYERNAYGSETISGSQNVKDVSNCKMEENEQQNKSVPRQNKNFKYLYTKDVNEEIKENDSDNNETKLYNMEIQKYFEQQLKEKERSIQEDIYKMDFVYGGDENDNTMIDSNASTTEDFLMDDLIVHTRLRTSLQDFLKRAEQNISNVPRILLELPIVPKTRPIHASFASRCWKLATTHKTLENDNQLVSSENNSLNSHLSEKNIDTSVLENAPKLMEQKKSESLITCPKIELPNLIQMQMVRKNIGYGLDQTQLGYEKKNNTDSTSRRCTVKRMEGNDVNALQKTASVAELATFKKQYYDTLLNIQKAKVAVANSLAISSVESLVRYDPYSNYSYHHHHQQQQQQQQQQQSQQQLLSRRGKLISSPQFTVHTMVQPRLSNMHNAPYTWVKYKDLRHPTRQLRFQHQPPFLYSKNKSGSTPQYTGTTNVQQFVQDKNNQVKQCVQRKKLEDIIGKLKEMENSNTND